MLYSNYTQNMELNTDNNNIDFHFRKQFNPIDQLALKFRQINSPYLVIIK